MRDLVGLSRRFLFGGVVVGAIVSATGCSDGAREIRTDAIPPVAPAQTAQFIGVSASTTEVDVDWESVSGATCYEVKRYELGTAADCDAVDAAT